MNKLAGLVLAVPLAFSASCGGADGKSCTVANDTITCPDGTTAILTQGTVGKAGTAGTNALSTVVAEPPGANCAAGGQAIETGLDTNGDGTLEASEVKSTTYVCDTPAPVMPTVETVQGNFTVINTLDLAQLASVKTITGTLTIDSTALLMVSLPTLQHVGGLSLRGEGALMSFSAAALTTIDTALDVEDVGNASSASVLTKLSLPALTTVQTITIDGTALTDLSGLATAFTSTMLTEVDIEDNLALKDVSALAATKLDHLELYDNGLVLLTLPTLTNVTNEFNIDNNALLTAISLPAFLTVGEIDLGNNPVLTTIHAPKIAGGTDSTDVYNDPLLTDCLFGTDTSCAGNGD